MIKYIFVILDVVFVAYIAVMTLSPFLYNGDKKYKTTKVISIYDENNKEIGSLNKNVSLSDPEYSDVDEIEKEVMLFVLKHKIQTDNIKEIVVNHKATGSYTLSAE